ncbi:hypothetical protein [Bartonella rattimassiliensis]|uniref:Uncharacterized protein n=1 Tax=Bartonella rattimassiliensis 15908 TaxID=1094556 RepID=J0QPK5_9HYPH|nr:hypothetical protein [Bartonella rattimassiliensis]EJF87676.1 hypothetical protein MCY_00130 [Bartonella rattimassiliensis 15908]
MRTSRECLNRPIIILALIVENAMMFSIEFCFTFSPFACLCLSNLRNRQKT